MMHPDPLMLDVRPVSQHSVHIVDDPFDNQACWYAAALMVLSYRGVLAPLELVNLRSAARLWQNRGVQPHHLDRLADEAGLEHTAAKALFPRMGAVQWREALATLGPLMVVLTRRHMIVVRGIVRQGDDWQVVFNDPFTGAAERQALLRFNGGVDWRMPILFRRSAHRPPVMLRRPIVDPLSIRY